MGIWLNLGDFGNSNQGLYRIPGKTLENFHANINITSAPRIIDDALETVRPSARTSDYRRQKKTIPSPSSTGSEANQRAEVRTKRKRAERRETFYRDEKRRDGRSRESRGRVSGSFVSSERNDVARYKRGRVGEVAEGK